MTAPASTDQYASWRENRQRRLLTLLLAGRPPVFAAAGTLDERLARWAKHLADGRAHNLLLTGGIGVGKTWSLWHAAELAVRCGFAQPILITNAAEFHASAAPKADPGDFARLTTAGLLVLDDLGAVGLSAWDLERLWELADHRWRNQLPTALSTNRQDLGSIIGERVASRLRDGLIAITLRGADRRQAAPRDVL